MMSGNPHVRECFLLCFSSIFKGKDAHRYETKFSSLQAPVFLLVQNHKGGGGKSSN